jgi:PAS domain S-box-containing protein/putative nucleotidyltransferase with HDIG domain
VTEEFSAQYEEEREVPEFHAAGESGLKGPARWPQPHGRMLFDASPDPTVFLDLEGVILDMNREAEAAFGCRDEVIGSNFFGFPLDPGAIAWGLERLLRTGEVRDLRLSLRSPSGHVVHKLFNMKLCRDDAVMPPGIIATARDALDIQIVPAEEGERPEVRRELVRLQRLFSTLFVASPDLVVVTNKLDGKILDCNPGFERMLGWTRTEAIGQTMTGLGVWVHAGDRAKFIRELSRTRGLVGYEAQFRRKDGGLVPATVSGSLFEIDGETRVVAVAHDATARLATAATLQASEERFRSIVTTMEEGVIFQDADGKMIAVNPAAERILGIRGDNLPAEPPSKAGRTRFLRTGDSEPLALEERPSARTLRTGKPQSNLQVGFERPDGRIVWLSVNTSPIFHDRPDRASGVVITIRDITESRAALLEIDRSRERLEELLGERERNLALLRDAFASVVEVLSRVVEMRDPYTSGHQRRVASLAVSIAREIGVPEEEVESIRIAALIHDVGKLSVPAEILSRPGRLSEAEHDIIRGHAEAGFRVLASTRIKGDTAELVYQHHERCDGSGYPRRLSGDELLPGAKILMVADVVEAMMSHRPYRPALDRAMAFAEIAEGRGTRYDERVCDACVTVFAKGFEFLEE